MRIRVRIAPGMGTEAAPVGVRLVVDVDGRHIFAVSCAAKTEDAALAELIQGLRDGHDFDTESPDRSCSGRRRGRLRCGHFDTERPDP